jgi:hypothetical protein
MLLKLISAYYIYVWMFLAGLTALKIVISFIINNHIENLQGIIFSVFKWYNEDDKELAENKKIVALMQILNGITILLYFVLFIIIILSILPMFLS